MILESLKEAQAVYSKQFSEQKEAGGKYLDAWLTVRRDALRIVVRDYRGEHPMSTCYEYDLWFECVGIHEIEKGVRRKRFKRPQLRQTLYIVGGFSTDKIFLTSAHYKLEKTTGETGQFVVLYVMK